MSSEGDRFDAWLEEALRREEAALPGPHPLPAQARYQALAAASHGRLHRVAALASNKALTGVALAVITAAAAGAATEAVVTGTINPSAWVQQGIAQVEKCSAALGGGGMAECANSFSLQHGNPRSGAPGARGEQSGEPSNGHGGRPSPSHGSGPPTDKGVPPTDKGGPPTNKPAGPPSAHPSGGAPSTPSAKPSPGSHASTPATGAAPK